MINRYTFLKHPFHFVLENASGMVTGLDKCVAIFYNEEVDNVEVMTFDNKIIPIQVDDLEFIKLLRKTKKQTNWIKENQVVFEVDTLKIEQLSFKDEEESSVLEMRFLNPTDGNYDVLYFYFKNNIGNFKLSSVDEAMAITVKQVIQNLLYKQVALLLNEQRSNALIHQKIKNTLTDRSLQDKISVLEVEQFEQAKSTYTYLLSRLTEQEDVEFILSNQAVKKIMAYQISLFAVEELLLNSLELVLNKYNPKGFYELDSRDVLLKNDITPIKTSISQENLNKTQQFLDRYEAAAKVLQSKNKKITGLNIGGACYPKISPAAISDVLKKHQKKITTLFIQYPERWSLIRSHFKPIVNLVERFGVASQVQIGA